MFSTLLASLLIAQQSAQAVVSEFPDQPKTWTIDYPFLIDDYVADYFNCLQSQEVFSGREHTFEGEHRKAVTTCAKRGERAEKQANALLAETGRHPDMTPEKVAEVFVTLRTIHIERGRDLDAQIAMGLGGNPYAEQIQEPDATVAIPASEAAQ